MKLSAKYAEILLKRLQTTRTGEQKRRIKRRMYYLCYGGSIHRMKERVPL